MAIFTIPWFVFGREAGRALASALWPGHKPTAAAEGNTRVEDRFGQQGGAMKKPSVPKCSEGLWETLQSSLAVFYVEQVALNRHVSPQPQRILLCRKSLAKSRLFELCQTTAPRDVWLREVIRNKRCSQEHRSSSFRTTADTESARSRHRDGLTMTWRHHLDGGFLLAAR